MLHPKQTQHLFLTIQAEKLCTACTVNIKEESSLLSDTVVGTVDRYTARTTEGHCKKNNPYLLMWLLHTLSKYVTN